MDQSDHPGFRVLATEDDESRWWADQAALRRDAARTAGVERLLALETSGAEPLIARRRLSPVLVGGGLAVAVAAIVATPLLLSRSSPGRPVHEVVPEVTRGEPAPAPITTRPSLPCSVNGAGVGALPLMDCAARGGVASGRLDVAPSRPSTNAISSADEAGRAAEDKVPAPTTTKPPPARPIPTPPPAQIVLPAPRAEAPLRAARQPPAEESAPYADRLDDSTLASVDARREPSRAAEEGPSPAESAQAAGDFYTALGRADGARASALVVPEKRYRGPLSAPAIDRFFSSLTAPLRITDLRPIDSHTVAVRYKYLDPDGVLCSGSSEVDTTVRGERVLVQGIRVHSRC